MVKPANPATTVEPLRALELDRFVPYRLSVLANTMSGAIASAYAERFELSIPEWRIVAVLARAPGLSSAQVAERTAMDKVAVSRGVAALVRSRRIDRGVEESDRRRSQLRLTAKGMAVYHEVVPWALAYEDAVLRGLSARARQSLDRLLDELLQRARKLRPAAILRPAPASTRKKTPRDPVPTRILRE